MNEHAAVPGLGYGASALHEVDLEQATSGHHASLSKEEVITLLQSDSESFMAHASKR